MIDYAAKISQGLPYDESLAKHGNDDQRRRWAEMFQSIKITDSQAELIRSFPREMPVVILAGAWCGDCVNQWPSFEHFAQLNSELVIRYFGRETHPDLGAE